MSPRQDFNHDPAPAELSDPVERFEAAWRRGEPPAIDDFLPSKSDQRIDVLVDLIHVDMEQRLDRGEGIEVEQYIASYPELAAEKATVLDLIAGEYRLRQARDPQLTVPRFAERFPEYREDLALRLAAGHRPARRGMMRLNCPHCHTPIEVGRDAAADEILCPSCGSSFRVDTGRTQTWTKDRLPTLGRFELIEAVGRGAFGTVYRARDTQLARTVAVKVPRSGRLTTDEDEDRFVREARNAAQLQHPGIVSVYEVGRSETFPYIVGEFVDGVTLADALTARKFGFREAARLMARVAEALDHAHKQGVVHRDLKPSNIMLTVDGAPRVMDFGLAKRDAGEVTMTVDGQVLGTPAYMSPEQASGQAHHVDGRSDVYSLGGVLYELLTGELPFLGNQRMILHQVLHDEPRSPRSLNDRIPRDLETICLKAMAKEPSRRYQTAGAMSDDLARFLAGKPIAARPVGRVERLWRWCKRNPLVASLSAAVVVALVSGATVSAIFAIDARARAREALVEKARADINAADAKASAERATREEAKATSEAERATREAAAANRVTDFIAGIFQTSDAIGLAGLGLRREGETAKDLTLDEVLRRGSRRIPIEFKGEPRLQARLMDTVGNVDRSLGFYQDAEPLLREALKLREARAATAGADRADHLALAESQFNLAWLLHDLGSYDEAESLYRKALATRSELLEADDATVVSTKFNLAWVFADTNRNPEAEQLFREVISARRKTLPSGHRDILLAQVGLAAILWSEGKELAIVRETLPSLPGDVLLRVLTLYEMARVQRQIRSFDLATRSYQTIVETAREHLPAEHPILAAILVDMAGMLKEKGDYPAAEKAIREAVEIVLRVMGGHPKLVRPLQDFAEQLVARGDFEEAETRYRDALAISQRRRARDYNEHIGLIISVANCLRWQCHYDAALEMLDKALATPHDPQSGTHRDVVATIAQVCYEAGDWSRASSLIQEILSNPANDGFIDLKLALRECLLDLGRYEDAKRYLQEVREALQPFAVGHPEKVDPLINSVRMLAAVDKYDLVPEATREVIRLDKKQLPANHPIVAQHREQLVAIMFKAWDSGPQPDERQLEMAEGLLVEAEQMYRRSLGDDHAWIARNALLRARLAASRSDWSGAVQFGHASVAVLGARFAPEHAWMLQARHQLAVYQGRAGEMDKAIAQLREVLTARQKLLPPLHADILETGLALAQVLHRQGNDDEAQRLLQEMLNGLAKVAPADNRHAAHAEAILGACLAAQQRFELAEGVLARSQAAHGAIYGQDHPRTRAVVEEQAKLYKAWNKPQRAVELRRALDAK